MYLKEKIINLFPTVETISIPQGFGVWDKREKLHGVHKDTMSIPFVYLPNGSEDFNRKNIQYINDIPLEISTEIQRLEQHFNGYCVKAIAVSLPAGKKVDRHMDMGKILTEVHRCHIPIQTSKDVAFFIRDTWYNLREGFVYEISNVDEHEVVNGSDIDRIHLIIDIKEYNEASS